MKLVIVITLLSLLFSGSGCMTINTVEAARARTHNDEKGEEVVDKKAEPGYYALIPLTVAGDTATLPFQLFITLLFYCSGIRC